MTARDLFAEQEIPPQVTEAARPGIGTIPDRYTCGGTVEPEDRTSIEWFAWKQSQLRAAGEASARAFAESKRKAQEGIDQAVAHADRDAPGWSSVAFEFVKLHAMQNRGARFTGYEIVRAALAYGVPKPPTDKAFGGPIQRAARAGLIRKVGSVADPNPERHGSDVPLWEAA